MDEIEKIEKEYEQKHVQNIILLAIVLDRIYFNAINKIWLRLWPLLPTFNGVPFDIERKPLVLKLLNGFTNNMIKEMERAVTGQIRREWKLSDLKNESIIRAMFQKAGRDIPEGLQAKLFPGNERALQAFLNRSTAGLKLSERIWNLKPQILTEIESGLQLSIAEGKSAAQQATMMKLYLKDPDRLYRRVRDKYGRLVLSKAAREYHPGQGKYRSSYKNALRLVRNEINMAYRTADHERWKEQKFVLGIEIKLSNRHVIEDVCNHAVGKYPVGFKFTGFHPSCLCYAIPIRLNEEQFNEYVDSLIAGNEYEFTGHINDVPANLKAWYTENKTKIEGWRNQPYWIIDNAKFLKSK